VTVAFWWPLRLLVIAALCAVATTPAAAGPPFQSDDPTPTPSGGYEVYLFATGNHASGEFSGDAGVDFNYGAGPDLQLTATIPISYEDSDTDGSSLALGNIELAAKYRLLHQESLGWDVAIFPRLFLPSSSDITDKKTSFLLPVWVGKEMGDWSTFGGGGYHFTQGVGSRDYWIAGWALTRKVSPGFSLGVELFHQSADSDEACASTTLGLGATYDVTETVHLLSYVAAGLENTDDTGRVSWYASVLITF
jgi:hypothetical protein